jgi:hypothetical protein
MMRRFTAIAASALAAAMSLGFTPGAHAAAKAPIQSYRETFSVVFTGFGKYAGYYSRYTGSETVALRPHLALDTNWANAFKLHGVHRSSGQADIGNGRLYTRTGNGRQYSTYAYEYNPYTTQAKFDALPGVQRTTPRHLLVKGTYAKVGSYLAWEFGATAPEFKGTNFKTFTIELWVDASGRPVLTAAFAKSALYTFSAVEIFSRYNLPVTIKIP